LTIKFTLDTECISKLLLKQTSTKRLQAAYALHHISCC